MDIDINDLAMLGVMRDKKPYMLPPEAWTQALNMRYSNGAPEAMLGWERVFGTLGGAPYHLVPILTSSTAYWIYATLTKIRVYDGSSHADITRASGGDYAAGGAADWNNTILGGIPILNNGVDIPQFRANMTAGTKFANLTNWTSTTRAKIIRAYGPYLVAFNITESGTSRPHAIMWSHPADPGALPSSWDYTDATKDTGIKELEDVNSGVIIDALPLQGVMYVYKANATWRMTTIGGRFIFDFKALFETSGILAPRCVAIVPALRPGSPPRQLVVTQDDIIWHNGSKVVSILDQRERASLFAEIDTTNFGTSFIFANPLRNEMWFCYPTTGQSLPNKALVWNYSEGGEQGVISYADGITFQHAALGNIEGDSSELWSDGEDTWEEDTGPWSEFSRRRVLLANPTDSHMYVLDRTATRNGTEFTQTLQRTGLSVVGRKRNGEWIVDHQMRKLLQRLQPKVSGAPVNIRLGAQELVDGPILWDAAKSFDPSLSNYADNDPVAGAALAIEYSTTSKSWRLDGYKAAIAQLGQF